MNAVKKYLLLIAKLVVFTGILMLVMTVGVVPLTYLHDAHLLHGEWIYIDQEIVELVACLVASFLIIRFWDKQRHWLRGSLGLDFTGRGRDMLAGVLVAVVIYAVGFGISLAAGWVSVSSVNLDWSSLALAFMLYVAVALAEETMVRGFVLGHLLDTGMNRYLALALSSLLFSSLHLGNANFNVLAFINIFIAGLLLGSAYIYTRNLSFSVCLHLFWNWIEGPVLGYAVSGGEDDSLLQLSLSDNMLMNGGAFGFEASLPCTILMIVFIILILRRYEKTDDTNRLLADGHDNR